MNRILNVFRPTPGNLFILVARVVVWIMKEFNPSQATWTYHLVSFSLSLHAIFQSRGAAFGVLYVKGVRAAL